MAKIINFGAYINFGIKKAFTQLRELREEIKAEEIETQARLRRLDIYLKNVRRKP